MTTDRLREVLRKQVALIDELTILINELDGNRVNYYHTANKIIDIVGSVFDVDIMHQNKTRGVTEARAGAMYLLKQYTRLSHQEVVQLFRKNNHTTSIAAMKKCKVLMEVDEDYANKISECKRLINSN